MSNLTIAKDKLELTLCLPDIESGYYRGTRFDHSGIFRSIIKDGCLIAGEWFDVYDPYKHDAVHGTSEEFEQCGYDEAAPGETFLKPGVGLLVKENDVPYDHFHLYKVSDFGKWSVRHDSDSVSFIHEVNSDKWGYVYEKTIRLIDGERFEICHNLLNTGRTAIIGDTYNHNFFTFGDARPGPEIEVDFPFEPSGTWRSEYDSVSLTESGIRFSRALKAGESVFIGNLKPADGAPITGEVFRQRGNGYIVTFNSDKAFHRITFWSNHRIGCVEPFIPYTILPGREFCWNYLYKINQSPSR